MSLSTPLATIAGMLRTQGIDAWLVHDFRGCNPTLSLLLPGKRTTTRRCMLLITAQGGATLLCQGLDANQFEHLSGVQRETYTSWRDMQQWLGSRLSGCKRVAMEYAPGCTLPVVSIVDAGTVELVRSLGVEVVSSADVLQQCVAVWSAAAVANHRKASELVAGVKDEAFAMIRTAHAKGQTPSERQVQQHIVARFRELGLETGEDPIVAVNAHSGDPHFEVSATNPAPITPGDWVLIDLWSRLPGVENIYSDITWVGYCGPRVPTRHQQVFEVVRAARDASLHLAQKAWREKRAVQGWELDEAARGAIIEAGFERGIKHRTGHSLSPGLRVHGLGMNLDNLETHDTRAMLPGLGFTIEPGIYLPEFGVRLEINVFVDPAQGPVVTSCLQEQVVLMG